MMCDWDSLLAVLPAKLRSCIKECGKDKLVELRLRRGRKIEYNCYDGYFYGDHIVSREDIHYIVNAASRYSPWQAATMARGYLPVAGGHRIGISGEVIYSAGAMKGIRDPDSLCIRIAQDLPGIAAPFGGVRGSVLILGAPGWGKTTMLRDLARQMAEKETTVVLDERGELFPEGYIRGKRMDVLRFCPKREGIELAVRTLSPRIIALDEITEEADCRTILKAVHCGVRFLATIHAASLEELRNRKTCRMLTENEVFPNVLLLHQDKTCTLERMSTCR